MQGQKELTYLAEYSKMKIDKATSAYEHLERICNAIKGKRNLTQHDTATIVTLAIIDTVTSGLPAGKDHDWLVSDAPDAKQFRIALRDTVKPFFTAAKNVQNSIAFPMELLPEVKGSAQSVEEFV